MKIKTDEIEKSNEAVKNRALCVLRKKKIKTIWLLDRNKDR